MEVTTAKNLQDQELLLKTVSLHLPKDVLDKGIIFVNSVETLGEAASVLGLPLCLTDPSLPPFSQNGERMIGEKGEEGKKEKEIEGNQPTSISTASSLNSTSASLLRVPFFRLFVGVDSEWKAVRFSGEKQGAATLQVRTYSCMYVCMYERWM